MVKMINDELSISGLTKIFYPSARDYEDLEVLIMKPTVTKPFSNLGVKYRSVEVYWRCAAPIHFAKECGAFGIYTENKRCFSGNAIACPYARRTEVSS